MSVDVKVDISSDDIQKHVVAAILQSKLGPTITDAIQSAIKKLSTQYSWDNDLQRYIEGLLREIIREKVQTEYKETIEKSIRSWLATAKFEELTQKVIDGVVNGLTTKERY